MINIERTMPAQPSLAKQSFVGVKEALINMQANKCYLCERNAPDTSQIEHFIPTNNGGVELQFVWENLFLACDHCNSVKNNVSDKKKPTLDILDCTDFSTIISDVINFYCEGKPREKVIITPAIDEPSQSILDTVFLLDNIFNYQSESLAFDAKALTDEVIIEMKHLLDLLHEYDFGSHSSTKKERILLDIKDTLSVESPYTAFKIWYIKRNYVGTEFMELLPSFLKN
ncbi:MAG: HNH endonuclease [Saprospiraceae bacterium]|nr:HNH endonuclease [Saprospiraceae bacterium]